MNTNNRPNLPCFENVKLHIHTRWMGNRILYFYLSSATKAAHRWTWIYEPNSLRHSISTPKVPVIYNKSRNVLYVPVITCSHVIQPMATKNQSTLWISTEWNIHRIASCFRFYLSGFTCTNTNLVHATTITNAVQTTHNNRLINATRCCMYVCISLLHKSPFNYSSNWSELCVSFEKLSRNQNNNKHIQWLRK